MSILLTIVEYYSRILLLALPSAHVVAKEKNDHAPINVEWLKIFPNEDDRPAHQAMSAPYLEDGILLQCDFLAVLE